MVGLAIGILIVGFAIGVGLLPLRKLPLNGLERIAYGGALGLGALAYAVALMSAFHWLWGLWLCLGATALLGAWGWHRSASLFRYKHTPNPNAQATSLGIVLWGLWGLLALLTLALCLLPPDGNEWDALAYHLAFPKLYLQAGGMIEVPFMHQSYFPPLLDMLFLLGLWLDGEASAKVFHWAMGLLTALGMAGFVSRLGGQGGWSALLWLSTPVVAWQASTAYIDLSTALYVSLGAFALHTALHTRETRWLWLVGVLLGFALATKYTALLSWGFLGLVGLVWCFAVGFRQAVLPLLLTGILVLGIGTPWYLRNWLWTGNPVYPFAYEIFGGKQWSQEQADAYRGDQLKFGMGREPAQLLLAPWNLTAHPMPFADPIGVQVGERVYLLPSSGLGILATIGILVATGLATGVGWLLAFVGLSLVGWFYMMQQIRYLIAVLPVFLGAGTAQVHLAPSWLKGLFGGVVILQACFTLWLLGSAYLPFVPLASNDRTAYLERRFQTYPALRFLNERAKEQAVQGQVAPALGVVLLDETRGYYLDIPYLWGNPGHHRLIPYEQFRSGRALVEWLAQEGYGYVLINYRFAPQGKPEPWRALYYEAIQQGLLQPLLNERGVVVYEIRFE